MRWTEWAQQLPTDGAGVRLVLSPRVHNAASAAERHDALATLGYIVVPATQAMDIPARRRCVHRHVALIVDDPLTPACVQWVRDLAMASPRAHLVVRTEEEASTMVRERAMAWSSRPPSFIPVPHDVRHLRAVALQRTGRHDASRTWLKAAVGAASRCASACRDSPIASI
ncbi:MAG: hypothetical protein O2917_03710 [Acidobacteria bacterium]|nr:hypothetical protein [Acidobacteriota bacterium]